jgi:hypothetical protein
MKRAQAATPRHGDHGSRDVAVPQWRRQHDAATGWSIRAGTGDASVTSKAVTSVIAGNELERLRIETHPSMPGDELL